MLGHGGVLPHVPHAPTVKAKGSKTPARTSRLHDGLSRNVVSETREETTVPPPALPLGKPADRTPDPLPVGQGPWGGASYLQVRAGNDMTGVLPLNLSGSGSSSSPSPQPRRSNTGLALGKPPPRHQGRRKRSTGPGGNGAGEGKHALYVEPARRVSVDMLLGEEGVRSPELIADPLEVCEGSKSLAPSAREEAEVASQIEAIEKAVASLRQLNAKGAVVAAGGAAPKMVDAATQCEDDTAALSVPRRSPGLLAVDDIPVRTKPSRGRGERHAERNLREVLSDGTGASVVDVYREYCGGGSSRTTSHHGSADSTRAANAQHVSPHLYAVLSEMSGQGMDLERLVDLYTTGVATCLASCRASGAHLYTSLGPQLVRHVSGGKGDDSLPLDCGIVGHAIKARQTVTTSDPISHRFFDPRVDITPAEDEKHATWFYIPVKFGHRVLGVAVVHAESITPEQAAGIELLTMQIVSPLFLHHPDMARLDISESILGAVGDLTENMFEDKKLVDRIVQSSKLLLNAERCSLFFVDEKAQQLVTTIDGSEVRISLNSGIAGFVAVTGKGENIRNAYSDPRFNRTVDKKTGFKTREILCMPLKLDGKVIAVAQLVNNKDRVPFSAFDEEVFQTYSSFAAVALRNNKVHSKAQRAKDWNNVLLSVASALGDMTQDESALRTRIVDQSLQLVEAEAGTIFAADWESAKLRGRVRGKEVELPINCGITGACVLSGQAVNVVDAHADPRFDSTVDQAGLGSPADTILCIPIKFQHKVIAVAQLLNRTLPKGSAIPRGRPRFTQSDEAVMESLCVLGGVALGTAKQYKGQLEEKEMFRDMLAVVGNLMEFDIGQGRDALSDLVTHDVRILVGKCDQVNVYGVDGGECIGLLGAGGDDGGMIDQGMRDYVIRTREAVALRNTALETHSYFTQKANPAVRGLIVAPVTACGAFRDRVSRANVHAVLEVVNSTGGFTDVAQQRLSYYLNLVALSMRNIALLEFEKRNEANAMELIALSSNVGTQQTTPSSSRNRVQRRSQTEALLSEVKATSIDTKALVSFQFDSDTVSGSLSTQLANILHMFTSLSLLERLHIDEAALVGFIVAIALKYRKVPYHNFVHAFDVMQALYALLHLIDPKQFSDLELFTLLLCALCHDVEHMGVSNSYHYASETPMGILSNATGASSPLEVHHCNVMLSKLAEHNLLSNMDHAQQVAMHKLAIGLILATDMAKHQTFMEDLSKLNYDKNDDASRRMALFGLFKYADISNTARPFGVAERWGMRVVEEFHSQGDKEKEQFGQVSMSFYDRDHAENAKIQVDFIALVCEPYMQELLRVWPELYTIQMQLKSNKEQWMRRLSKAHEDSGMMPAISVSGGSPRRSAAGMVRAV